MNLRKLKFAFLGTSQDSQFALAALRRASLEPTLIIDSKEFPDELTNSEWDFLLVCSFGKILPKAILDLPKHGCINIHPSLLPRYRGPSPYVSAILADERVTGVTVMMMEEEMDAGPILAQARIEIDEADWPPKGLVLSEMLFAEGVNLLVEILPALMEGTLTPQHQNEGEATFTRKYHDKDALLDLSKPREAFLKIRAFDKNPRAHFITATGKRVIVTEASWKDGSLVIEKVLPEGKKEMPYADYQRGQR